MKKISYLIRQYINENLYAIILLIGMFSIGTIIGIIYANSLDNDTKIQLISYVKDINYNVVNEKYVLNNFHLIISTIKLSLIYIIVIYILGCTVVLSPLIYAVFLYKGLSIGFCSSIVIMLLGNVKGSIYSIISMFVPCIIFVMFLLFLSILWIKFGKNILHNKNLYNFKQKIYINSIITMIITIILITCMIPIQLLINNILYYFIKII